ncbi:MAG: hypothetical protein ACI4Q3_05660 [Kiritimatiellia bacterium]
MAFWFFMLGFPVLAYGLVCACSPAKAAAGQLAFARNRVAGGVLCALGWLFTAYEVDTIGIDVFDQIVRRLWFLPREIPGAVWIWAVVLCVLTCLWMPNLLPIRGLSALFMLFPAELFPVIRLCETPWRLTLVVFAYGCAIAGMYAMFYPWKVRQFMSWQAARPDRRLRLPGAVWAATGGLFLVLGALSAAGVLV